MKVIGIVGSRRRNAKEDYHQLIKVFESVFEPGDEIVSGGCPEGGDNFAEGIAKKYQVPIKIYYAQWNKLGKGAGFARNGDIARDSDVLLALVAADRTGGTEDTIKKFTKVSKKTLAENVDALSDKLSNLYLLTPEVVSEGVDEDTDPLEMEI